MHEFLSSKDFDFDDFDFEPISKSSDTIHYKRVQEFENQFDFKISTDGRNKLASLNADYEANNNGEKIAMAFSLWTADIPNLPRFRAASILLDILKMIAAPNRLVYIHHPDTSSLTKRKKTSFFMNLSFYEIYCAYYTSYFL